VILHRLGKGEGTPQLDRQIIKVLGSEGEHGRISRRYFQIERKIFLYTPLKVEIPTFFQEAVNSPNHKEWIDVIRDEIDSITRNKAWEFIDLPP